MTGRTFRRHAIAPLGLCLLLFQLQLFAASALGCLHQGEAGGADRGAGCPYHAVGGDAANPAPATPEADPPLTDCVKCALYLGLHHALGGTESVALLPQQRARSEPRPPRHFYQYTPDPLRKPPRSAAR